MFELDRFVADCRAALTSDAPHKAVREVVARAVSEPAAVLRAVGEPRRAELRKLYGSAELTILNVVWAPGMILLPHDHRMWAVIGLYGGREDNTFYRRAATGLVDAGAKRLDVKDVTVLGRDVIHAVANPSRQFTGAIHVYGGDFFGTLRSEWDPDTREERPYDVQRAMQVFVDANERWRGECAR